MIDTKLYDKGDGITYDLSFSPEDAKNILCSPAGKNIKLPSIVGSICLEGNTAGITYKNGSSGHGTIFSDYEKLCDQVRQGLYEMSEAEHE